MRSSRIIAIGFVIVLTFIAAVPAIFLNFSLCVPRITPEIPQNIASRYPDENWQSVTISARDGAQLVAWFIRDGSKLNNCVVVLHGIGDSRQGSAGFAPLFLDAGYSVLLPDSRAHGSSGGQVVTFGLLERYDLIEWSHWLRRSGCRNIYGLGESLGGSILIQASAIEPIFQAAVAESAFADLTEIAEYRVSRLVPMPEPLNGWFSTFIVRSSIFYAKFEYGLDFSKADPRISIERTATPILLIHGLQDTETPPSNSRTLASLSRLAALWIVPGAAHVSAYSTAPEEYRERVLKWFAEH